MPNATLRLIADVGGVSVNAAAVRTAAGQISHQATLALAKAGTLSTRTNHTDGTLTLGAAHGILTADVIDLYWTGGRRYGVVVGVVAGNDCPISGGLGDNLPAEDAAITCQKQRVINTDFEGDLLAAIVANCDQRGHLGFYDGANLRAHVDLAAGEAWSWVSNSGPVNPLATFTLTHAVVTQASDTAALRDFRLGILYAST